MTVASRVAPSAFLRFLNDTTFDSPLILIGIQSGYRHDVGLRCHRRVHAVIRLLRTLRLLLLLLRWLRRWFDIVFGGVIVDVIVGFEAAVGSGRSVRHAGLPFDGITDSFRRLIDDFDFDQNGEEFGIIRFRDVASANVQDGVGTDFPAVHVRVISAVQHGAEKVGAGEGENYR